MIEGVGWSAWQWRGRRNGEPAVAGPLGSLARPTWPPAAQAYCNILLLLQKQHSLLNSLAVLLFCTFSAASVRVHTQPAQPGTMPGEGLKRKRSTSPQLGIRAFFQPVQQATVAEAALVPLPADPEPEAAAGADAAAPAATQGKRASRGAACSSRPPRTTDPVRPPAPPARPRMQGAAGSRPPLPPCPSSSSPRRGCSQRPRSRRQ